MWPWSEIKKLRKELKQLEIKLDACGLAALGGFNGLNSPNCFSQSLVEVIALRNRFDKTSTEEHRFEPPQVKRDFVNPLEQRP